MGAGSTLDHYIQDAGEIYVVYKIQHNLEWLSMTTELLSGKKWNDLRSAHEKKDFDKIDYCKDCDFLYSDPEVLVWSNDPTAKVHHMLGTDEDFILSQYEKKEENTHEKKS